MVLNYGRKLVHDPASKVVSYAGRKIRKIGGRHLQVMMRRVDCIGRVDANNQYGAG